jgi:hypothetical protein
MGLPADMTAMIKVLASREESGYMTGACVVVDGGATVFEAPLLPTSGVAGGETSGDLGGESSSHKIPATVAKPVH